MLELQTCKKFGFVVLFLLSAVDDFGVEEIFRPYVASIFISVRNQSIPGQELKHGSEVVKRSETLSVRTSYSTRYD